MKISILLFFIVFFISTLQAQQCGNCKSEPKVSVYDVNIQIAAPGAEPDMAEWSKLNAIASFAKSHLINENKKCIYFVQALSNLSDGGVGLAVGGMGSSRLPPEGNLTSLGGYRYDYILTGNIQKQGAGYIMQLEIQNACSRDVIKSVSLPFQLTDNDQFEAIGLRAAGLLTPLIDPIMEYELEEREQDPSVAIGNFGINSRIQIKPKKKKLASGEETEIEIILKDCDGEPLKNREVSFSANTLHGFAIHGTTGGTMRPATVTTDDNGKAKAMFKMGSSGTAMINAHYIFQKPTCQRFAKIGSHPINATPILVEVYYLQDETTILKSPSFMGKEISENEIADITYTTMHHAAVLHHYPAQENIKAGFLITDEPADNGKMGKIVAVSETGSYYFKHISNEVVLTTKDFGFDAQSKEQDKYEVEEKGQASFKYPSSIQFFKGNDYEAPYFAWFVEYPETGKHPDAAETVAGNMVITKDDPGVSWEVNKITDPASLYKTEYWLSLHVDAAEEQKKGREGMKDLFGVDFQSMLSKDGQDGLVDASGYKKILVRILSPYADQ